MQSWKVSETAACRTFVHVPGEHVEHSLEGCLARAWNKLFGKQGPGPTSNSLLWGQQGNGEEEEM